MDTPATFLEEYARRLNTHRFAEVAPLIDPGAVFWFSDGAHHGPEAIRQAVEGTWQALREEAFWIEDLRWLIESPDHAACIYTFHWTGRSASGEPIAGSGRGTTILSRVDGRWRILHEHLSPFPAG